MVVEKTLALIREESDILQQKKKLERAAKLLLKDYQTNRQLTALSVLDKEDFYETR